MASSTGVVDIVDMKRADLNKGLRRSISGYELRIFPLVDDFSSGVEVRIDEAAFILLKRYGNKHPRSVDSQFRGRERMEGVRVLIIGKYYLLCRCSRLKAAKLS